MNGLPLEASDGGGRFPGFDTVALTSHWDRATQAVVGSRLGLLPHIRFFTPQEEATASALFDQLLYQRSEPRVPIVQLVDIRLAEQQTDGWHYDTMPRDDQAWRDSLSGLNADANDRHGIDFAASGWDDQSSLLQAILDLDSGAWRGMEADRVWSLWTRYACTAFYSHPWAWDEIGFAGPAYPRGYKNIGLDRLEPFEVRDAHPNDDPARRDESAEHAGEDAATTEDHGPEAAADHAGEDSSAEGGPPAQGQSKAQGQPEGQSQPQGQNDDQSQEHSDGQSDGQSEGQSS